MENISKNSINKKNLESLEKRLMSKIEEENAKLATKEETAKLATKEEIAKLVTKEELENLEHRFLSKLEEETAKLSTKESVEGIAREVRKHSSDIEDLKKDMSEVKGNIKILQWQMSEMSEIKEKIDEMHKNFHTMLNAADGISAKYDIFTTEKAAIDHALSRQDTKINDHEIRIKRLELKRA